MLSRSSARRLVYFHCDHFEPWRSKPRTISVENAELVAQFAERTAKLDYARRLTLFYRPHCRPINEPRTGGSFVPGDTLGFLPLDAGSLRITSPAIRSVVEAGHELQLHLHHERVTANDRYSKETRWSDHFEGEGVAARDASRFELLVQLSLETARQESGCAFDEWLFIHGNWALAASDPAVCRIENELEILRRNGCVGDFTFTGQPRLPACNPSFIEPALVRTAFGLKAYDGPDADARVAWAAGALADQSDRLFIWSSRSGRIGQALDYRNAEVAARCESPQAWAEELARRAIRLGDSLYVWTYAHSMSSQHGDVRSMLFPHEHSAVRSMFGFLFDGAAKIGMNVEFLTASEVRRQILGGLSLPELR